MTTSPPFVGKFGRGAAFFFAALGSSAAMRLLIRTHPSAFNPWLGLLTLTVGVTVAWLALRWWREAAPVRCATMVGLSAGCAGAGLYILLGCLLVKLTPAGLVQESGDRAAYPLAVPNRTLALP